MHGKGKRARHEGEIVDRLRSCATCLPGADFRARLGRLHGERHDSHLYRQRSGPISYTQADAVDEIVVESLTGDVSGSDGMAISLSEAGDDGSGDSDDGADALPATVTFAGTNGSDTYGISGATDTSVTVTSTGGAGHSGS